MHAQAATQPLKIMKSSATLFTRLASWASGLLILAAMLTPGGRSLDRPASAGFAGVSIFNQNSDKIRAVTTTVFVSNGYQSIGLYDGALVFEKEATRGEQIAYAGFAGAQDGVKTVVRVRLSLSPQGVNSYMLGCNAYVVTNPGDSVFEQSFALMGYKSGPYQKLLDNVKATLQSSPAT